MFYSLIEQLWSQSWHWRNVNGPEVNQTVLSVDKCCIWITSISIGRTSLPAGRAYIIGESLIFYRWPRIFYRCSRMKCLLENAPESLIDACRLELVDAAEADHYCGWALPKYRYWNIVPFIKVTNDTILTRITSQPTIKSIEMQNSNVEQSDGGIFIRVLSRE